MGSLLRQACFEPETLAKVTNRKTCSSDKAWKYTHPHSIQACLSKFTVSAMSYHNKQSCIQPLSPTVQSTQGDKLNNTAKYLSLFSQHVKRNCTAPELQVLQMVCSRSTAHQQKNPHNNYLC